MANKKIQNPNLKLQVKNCIVCSRPFTNRKSWNSRGLWESIKYCSTACSKFKVNVEYKKKFNLKK